MIYFRCLFPLLLTVPFAIVTGVSLFDIPKEVSFDVCIRNILWAVCVCLNFIAMKIMPLTKYTVILSTAPIMTSVLGYFTINEKLSVFDFISCISSFVGVILIVTNPDKDRSNPIIANDPWWSFLLPAVSALFASTGDIFQRKFSNKINPTVVQIWMYIITMAFSFVISLGAHSMGDVNLPSFTLAGIGYLLLLSVVGVLGLMFYMLSLKYEKAGRVAAVNYLQILVMMLIDTFYFKIRLTLRDIVGASLIFVCNSTITFLKAMKVIS